MSEGEEMQYEENSQGEEMEEDENYRTWKKNSPYLYDVLITHSLEWPSLTVNWMPNINVPDNSYFSLQKLVLGTLTSGKDNEYILITKTRLPIRSKFSDVKDNKAYNEAFETFKKSENKIEIETKIRHDGEVDKLRIMPQKDKFNIIATKTVSGEVHIFDYYKQPTKPKDEEIHAEKRLTGHTAEGFGLCWNYVKEGYLASGSNDKIVNVYDINANDCSPLLSFKEHTKEVEDVSFNKLNENILISCGDDKKIIMYDTRSQKIINTINDAHSDCVNSIDFNPINDFLVISGSSDKSCALWDIRNMNVKLHSFIHHKGGVSCVKWNWKKPFLFGSASEDNTVKIWDVTQIGGNIGNEDGEDGPSELLFTHGGHVTKVDEIDWNYNEELMCASISEDNDLHIFEMENSIYYNEDK